jgi:hypothetical protein
VTHRRPAQSDVEFLQLRQMIALALAAWLAEYLGVVPDQTMAVLRPGTSGINADRKPPRLCRHVPSLGDMTVFWRPLMLSLMIFESG